MAVARTVKINGVNGTELTLDQIGTTHRFLDAYDSERNIMSINFQGTDLDNDFFIKFLTHNPKKLTGLLKINLRDNPRLAKKDGIKDGIKELAYRLASSGIIEIHLSKAEIDQLENLITKAAQSNRVISIYIDLTKEQFDKLKLVLPDKTKAIYTDTTNRVKIFNTSSTLHSTITNKDLRVAPLQPTDQKDQVKIPKNQVTDAKDKRDQVRATPKMEYKTPETISAVAPITAPQLVEQKVPSIAEHGAGAGTNVICDRLNVSLSELVKQKETILTTEHVAVDTNQESAQKTPTPEQPKHLTPQAANSIQLPSPNNELSPLTDFQLPIGSIKDQYFAVPAEDFEIVEMNEVDAVQSPQII